VRAGPRLPGFVGAVVQQLGIHGHVLAGAPPRLLSDGRAAGWGERVAATGALRDLRHALYVAGGTGVAEALLHDGRFPPTPVLHGWLEPAWRLTAATGEPYEDLFSMAGINAAWARRKGEDERFVEKAAAEGCEAAREVLREAAHHLAAFLFSRLEALHRRGSPALERIVLGQRTADLFADGRLAPCFADALRNRLASRLLDADDAGMRRAYLEGGELRADLLVASTLHAAPALGAVAVALGLDGPAMERRR